MNRFLYEFSVLKELEEKVVESKEENGEKIEISRTVKKIKEVKCAILEPRRRLIEGSDIFHAKRISEYIKADLVPISLVQKRYLNDGGPLSEPEKEKIELLRKEAKDLNEKLLSLEGTDEEKSKTRNDIIYRLTEINSENNQIRNSFSEIFENTVENKARSKTVEWWVLNLAYIDEGDGLKPFFGNGTHEEKLNKYDEYEEKDEPFYIECIKKFSFLISFWVNAGGSGIKLNKEEFKSMDSLYNDSLSTYEIQEKTDVKVEEKNS